MRGFADALDDIPMALSENSGFSSVDYVNTIKGRQVEEKNPYLGVDAMLNGTNDMKE